MNVSSIAFRATSSATGDIELVLGDVVFPIAGWNDFVVILGAWLQAFVRLLQDMSETEEVHFMDGPYVVFMKRVEGDRFVSVLSNAPGGSTQSWTWTLSRSQRTPSMPPTRCCNAADMRTIVRGTRHNSKPRSGH